MLTDHITANDIKKIFCNNANKIQYLARLFVATQTTERIPKKAPEIDQLIIDTWSYTISKGIIRDMFRNHPKFLQQQELNNAINDAMAEWDSLQLGDFEWPFSAQAFDQHVHSLNRNQQYSEAEKDRILTQEIIKFRRIKHINALRNDLIENIIFQNEDVIPTLGNRRGVDFYINGEPYDQKVGKSVGKAFKDEYGNDYRNVALSNPQLVAKSLYENQDEARFGDEARLLIVYLDNDVSSENIQHQLSQVDFSTPYTIQFNYTHSGNDVQQHLTKCFVVLLHN